MNHPFLAKGLRILLFFLTPAFFCAGQNNYVPGVVTLINGDTLSGQINDLNWNASPLSVRFKKRTGEIVEYFSKDVLQFSYGKNKIYKSRVVQYDSSSKKIENLTTSTAPTFKKSHTVRPGFCRFYFSHN